MRLRCLKVLGVGFLTVTIAAGLSGCREEEQGRQLRYEKGTYLGQADTPLQEEDRAILRQRAMNQRGP